MAGAPNPTLPANDDHLPVVSDTASNAIIQYVVSRRLMGCPNFGEFFAKKQAERSVEEKQYGYVMGYNYHGGHNNTPWPPLTGSNTWVSPQKLSHDSSLVLVSDLNDCVTRLWTKPRPAREEWGGVANGGRGWHFC